MHTTPSSSHSHSSYARVDVYAAGLTNANLFQTDFASVERRHCLTSLQRRMRLRESLVGHVHKHTALYRELYWTFRRHGLLRGMRPVFAILKRDAMEAFQ